jgi:hypothetical protein
VALAAGAGLSVAAWLAVAVLAGADALAEALDADGSEVIPDADGTEEELLHAAASSTVAASAAPAASRALTRR